MIYTVTLNPSIDYYVACNGLKMGQTNRTDKAELVVGGKGINVSIMLKRMGVESTALGFVAGFTGDEIERRLAEIGINTDFVKLDSGESRINVKIEDVEGTEINAPGPAVSTEAVNSLLDKISKAKEGDLLIMSGSIPRGIPSDIYEKMAKIFTNKGAQFIIDAEGELLLNTLKYKPVLVKPNQKELENLFNVKVSGPSDAIKYGSRLVDMGACNVIVSMAGDGAVLITHEGRSIYHEAVKGDFVNGVGAGDSMIAGFVAGMCAESDAERAFLQGIAAASATAFSTGLGDEKIIKKIYEKVLTTL